MQTFFEYIPDETARKLIASLESLMEETPLDRITTSDILEHSGVSRSTFYRRYRDKYDLLTKNYQILLDATLGQIQDGLSYKESFFRLYGALRSRPSFFRNALSYSGPNSLREYIFQQSYRSFEHLLRRQELDMDSPFYQLLLRGYIEGALEVTCVWVENGMQEPLDFLFRVSYELMPHEIQIQLALSYL